MSLYKLRADARRVQAGACAMLSCEVEAMRLRVLTHMQGVQACMLQHHVARMS